MRLSPTATPSLLGVILTLLGSAGCGDAARPTHFKAQLQNVGDFGAMKSGTFDTSVAGVAGPITSGQSFSFKFTAGVANTLTFACMFGQSNDWVFATHSTGIPLYQNGVPISGDVTSQVALYDMGTEVDEEPAVGAHTGPQQANSTTGDGALDPNPLVRLVTSPTTLSDGSTFKTPNPNAMIRVTVAADANTHQFTVTLTNVSVAATLVTSAGNRPVGISPGVWALGTGNMPLFERGTADRGEGMEDIAERGSNAAMARTLARKVGIATPASPGVWLVHGDGTPLFAAGQPDFGQGLADIAQSGNNLPLLASLGDTTTAGIASHGSFDVPEGATSKGPLFPGSRYLFEFDAVPGNRLSLATMFGWSNDWFYATPQTGVPLFVDGAPLQGDVTWTLTLWDAGTKLSRAPGVFFAPAGAPPTVADSNPAVRPVSFDDYAGHVAQHLRLILTADAPKK